MFYRIPDEFLLDIKRVHNFEFISSEYRGEDIEDEGEDLFKEADEEYISESIEE